MNYLIPCATCGRNIANLAPSCQSCGAPNDWVHPSIALLLSEKDKLGMQFTFTYTKTFVQRESNRAGPIARFLLTAIGGGFFILMTGGFGFILLPFIYIGSSLKEKFSMNFETNQWTSSSESYWKPVRQLFDSVSR